MDPPSLRFGAASSASAKPSSFVPRSRNYGRQDGAIGHELIRLRKAYDATGCEDIKGKSNRRSTAVDAQTAHKDVTIELAPALQFLVDRKNSLLLVQQKLVRTF